MTNRLLFEIRVLVSDVVLYISLASGRLKVTRNYSLRATSNITFLNALSHDEPKAAVSILDQILYFLNTSTPNGRDRGQVR